LLSFETVQQIVQERQNTVVDITAEVRVGAINTGADEASDAATSATTNATTGATTGVTTDATTSSESGSVAPSSTAGTSADEVEASGTIEIDCSIPENLDLQQCRIDVGS